MYSSKLKERKKSQSKLCESVGLFSDGSKKVVKGHHSNAVRVERYEITMRINYE